MGVLNKIPLPEEKPKKTWFDSWLVDNVMPMVMGILFIAICWLFLALFIHLVMIIIKYFQ